MSVKRKFGLLFLSAVVASLLCMAMPARADEMADVKKELAQKQKTQKALNQKASTLGKEVQSLRKDLVMVSKNLQKSEAKLLANQSTLKDLEQKRKDYVSRLYRDQQSMGGVIAAARKYTRNPMITILAHDDALDAARTMTVLRSVVPSIDQHSNFFQAQLAEVNKVEHDITLALQQEEKYRKDLNKQQKELEGLLATRNTLYQQTESERQEHKKVVDNLVEKSNDLEELLSNIQDKVRRRPAQLETTLASVAPADLRMPVQGTLKTRFNEDDELGALSKGMTFVTIPSAQVITPFSGIVKFAGPFKKYKQLLIIEHPQGYHSLIAGLENINTVVGAKLAAGEPVGTTDRTEAPRLYYELRKDGKPVNPQQLLSANHKQGKS